LDFKYKIDYCLSILYKLHTKNTFQFAGGSGYTPPPPPPTPPPVPEPEPTPAPKPESDVASLQEQIAKLEQENIELKM
jgi:hypothetical protein